MLSLSFLSPKEKWQIGPFEMGYYSPAELLGTLWTASDSSGIVNVAPENEALDLLIQEADTAIEPLLSGASKLLPVEKQVVLDTAIQSLLGKPQTVHFCYQDQIYSYPVSQKHFMTG